LLSQTLKDRFKQSIPDVAHRVLVLPTRTTMYDLN